MTPHPQAAELMAMARDMNTQMQLEIEPGDWATCKCMEALRVISYGQRKVRIKPRTIMIGDVEVPEPMRVAPEKGEPYWCVFLNESTVGVGIWQGMACEVLWLGTGALQATEQGAKDMLAALVKQLGGDHG